MEHSLRRLPGVLFTECGYIGGRDAEGRGTPPTYDDVCQGAGGWAEAVRVCINTEVLSVGAAIKAMLALHNPTAAAAMRAAAPAWAVTGSQRLSRRVSPWRRQTGGGQYRSAVWVLREDEAAVAEAVIREAETQLAQPLATRVYVVQCPGADGEAAPPSAPGFMASGGGEQDDSRGWGWWRAEEEHQQRYEALRSPSERGLSLSWDGCEQKGK